MRDRLVKLSVPLCEEFKARVQHVDMFACRICVFPLIASKYRTELHKALSHLVGLDETPERPVNVNSKVVYLVRGDVENGKPFRGVVTEEKPAGRYKVFDVDSGMVKTVAITDIIQLPLALCYIPPLVICMAVPPSAVDAQSPERIKEDSLVICRFKPVPLLCVQDAYPPVLLCDVRMDGAHAVSVNIEAAEPIEVRRLPSASFAVRIKGAGSGRRVHMKTPMLKEEEEYSVRLVAQDSDGCYFGTVSTPSSRPVYSRHEMGSSVRTYAPKERPETMANEERKRIMEQRRENVRRGEETIAETADSLRRERELFETAKSKREQDIALMTMQLQIANISRKLDEITTNSVPNAIAFGVGAYPLHTPLQLGSTYAQQQLQSQELQQSNQYVGKNSAEQNDGTMQQILCTQQNGTAVASCSSLPTFASARRAQTNVILVPTMQHPRSAGHCSASSTSTISSDLMRDSIGQQAQVRGKSQSRESLITSTACASEIMRREPIALSHAGTAQVGKASFDSAVKRSSKERHDRKHGLRPHTCLGNCSSDMRSEVEHSAHATGDHVRCVLSAQSTTTIGSNRTEILHHVHPRDRDGNVLCSSSESSDEGMGMEQSQSEKEGDGGGGKTKQYVKHVEMERGRTYVVKRSDEDYCNKNWPLFFVQIQENEQLHFMEQYLDSLQLQSDLPDDRVVVGTLCACYCNAFGAVFRAVITDVSDERVEVLYVDYGNYEVVDRKQLKSVDDQPEVIRTCAAMGIPCILSDVDSALTEGGNVEIQADVIAAMQMKVACSLEQFTLRFLRQRSDGVNTVEVVQKEHVRSMEQDNIFAVECVGVVYFTGSATKIEVIFGKGVWVVVEAVAAETCCGCRKEPQVVWGHAQAETQVKGRGCTFFHVSSLHKDVLAMRLQPSAKQARAQTHMYMFTGNTFFLMCVCTGSLRLLTKAGRGYFASPKQSFAYVAAIPIWLYG
uniref:Tudor domain-containing protein n=1 Tax=Parascaris univalens TaxID=6257 RepID=A0A914ZYN7_PARUN